jgi:hypothetical protein
MPSGHLPPVLLRATVRALHEGIGTKAVVTDVQSLCATSHDTWPLTTKWSHLGEPLEDLMIRRTSTFFWEADGGLSTVQAVADERWPRRRHHQPNRVEPGGLPALRQVQRPDDAPQVTPRDHFEQLTAAERVGVDRGARDGVEGELHRGRGDGHPLGAPVGVIPHRAAGNR